MDGIIYSISLALPCQRNLPSPSLSPRSCPPPSTPLPRPTTPPPLTPAPATPPALSPQWTPWTRTPHLPRRGPPAPSVHPNPPSAGGVIRTGLSSATTAVRSPRTPSVSLPYLSLFPLSSLQHLQPKDTSNASPPRSFPLPETHHRVPRARETDARPSHPHPRRFSITQAITRRHVPRRW